MRIANAQAFWGDSTAAAGNILALDPDIDYLTLDYLAEVTMSILARQKQKDPNLGFARDFLDVVGSLIPHWKHRSRLRLVTNAGGLNPEACAQSAVSVFQHAGLSHLKIASISGDDVLPHLRAKPDTKEFSHLETGAPLTTIIDKLVTANAYIGAEPVIEALRQGAQIVVTGRVADPSLTVAPCAHEFNWKSTDFDRIAAATIGGHLIECGTQVTGGISTDWLSLEDPHRLGFPIVEIAADGSIILTKPANTSGAINARTVKEQLLYEIGDPDNYISPDAIVSFLGLRLEELDGNHVRVTGARGRPTTDFYKVTATYRAGFRASGTLTIIGRDAVQKARRVGAVICEKLKMSGFNPQHYLAEVIGSGDTMPGVLRKREDLSEVVLRVSARDDRKDVIDTFAKELIPMVTAGPQGTTGYFDGRPTVREVFGYWPCLIRRELVKPEVRLMEQT